MVIYPTSILERFEETRPNSQVSLREDLFYYQYNLLAGLTRFDKG